MAPNFVKNLFTQMGTGKRSNLLSNARVLVFTNNNILVCFQNCSIDISSGQCTFGIVHCLNLLSPCCIGDHSCQTRKVAAFGLHAFVCRAAMSSSLIPSFYYYKQIQRHICQQHFPQTLPQTLPQTQPQNPSMISLRQHPPARLGTSPPALARTPPAQ